jgi:hypothetical protein
MKLRDGTLSSVRRIPTKGEWYLCEGHDCEGKLKCSSGPNETRIGIHDGKRYIFTPERNLIKLIPYALNGHMVFNHRVYGSRINLTLAPSLLGFLGAYYRAVGKLYIHPVMYSGAALYTSNDETGDSRKPIVYPDELWFEVTPEGEGE